MKTKLTPIELEACDILIEEILTTIIINDLDIYSKTARYNDYSSLYARRGLQCAYLIIQQMIIGVENVNEEMVDEFLESQYIVDELQTNWNRYVHSLN